MLAALISVIAIFSMMGGKNAGLIKEYQITLQGLKTPKVDMRLEEGEEPDARILEKIYLLEKCMGYVDAVFARFVSLRFGPDWEAERRRVWAWMRE